YSLGTRGAGLSVNVTGTGEPEHVPALGVTDGVLSMLGITPLLGRSFTRADDAPDSADTVILSYGYWSRKFGGDRSVIGSTMEVDGKPRAIIGVLPQGFRFLDMNNLALVLPMKFNRQKAVLGELRYGAMARLKSGVTLQQASADIERMLSIESRSFPVPPGASLKIYEDLRLKPNLKSLKQEVVGDVDKVLWVLMGGISLVLVIACANLANLLLVRAEGRQQELSIRAALGASRGRIAAQLFSESLILAVLGGLLGLGLAYGALQVLVALAPKGLPRLHEIGIDGSAVLFTLAVALVANLLFGSVPAFKYAGAGHGSGLRGGGRGMSESRERQRTRGILVIVQVALALVLLVSSGLMIRTFRALTRVNPGFVAPAEIQTFGVVMRDAQVPEPERVARLQEEILHKLEGIPGVTSVGISTNVPMDGSGRNSPVFVKDRDYASDKFPPLRRFEFVAPGFFQTLGIPLIAGRDFNWGELHNKLQVALVSEKFAREYWREPANALGKQIRVSPNGDWREVVGVVGDVHQDGMEKEAPTSFYWPVLIARFGGNVEVEAQRNVTFVIRSPRAGTEGLMKEIQQAVWSVAPNLPLAEVRTLNENYTKSLARTSFTLVMLALAGGMALFLGMVGLYGVLAYSVSQRSREIGIRLALGAQQRDVLRMVLGQGLKLTFLGVGIGLTAAFGVTRLMANLLFGVNATDPLTFASIALLLTVVASLACWIPARRATKVDPLIALRHE
ncbi:MAG: ABC transporter permease, partial [Acidobacteria bacterium]|nr:ABC transporter permease [Acidobacteriota bacterium]